MAKIATLAITTALLAALLTALGIASPASTVQFGSGITTIQSGNINHLPVLMPTPVPANLIRPAQQRRNNRHQFSFPPAQLGHHIATHANSFELPKRPNIHHMTMGLGLASPQLFPPTTSQIWVVQFAESNQPFPNWLNPNGFRDTQTNISIYFGTPDETGKSPIYAVYVNGVKVASQCTVYPTGGQLNFNLPYANGEFAVQVGMQIGSNNYYSNVVYPYATNGDVPGLPQSSDGCKPKCGGPVDVITGQLWYNHADFELSGPFGLAFRRSYHTSQAMETFPLQDLGPGWQDNYDAFLDLTNFAAGGTTFYDETGHFVYFAMAAPGQTVYDQLEGYALTENADSSGFTVTTRHNQVYSFDASGRLMKLTDRSGNTQTITRDTVHPSHIVSVTDALGRILNFTYDAQNHIKTVTSSPSGVSLTFAYGSPCYTGDLCSVTESDGQKWTYQYADYFNTHYNTGFHLLSMVKDPLGHIEEQNTFGIDSAYNYQVQTQSTDGGLNSLSFNYPYAPSNTQTFVTDGLNRVTTYTEDPIYNVIGGLVYTGPDIQGPLCNCGGSEGNYTAHDGFGRLIERDLGGDSGNEPTYYYYGRDVVLSFPYGTSYIGTPYPEITEVQKNFSVEGFIYTYYTYYPLLDSRQDLVNVTTLPSVDTNGQHKTITDTYNLQGLLTAHAVQGYVGGNSQTYTTNYSYDARGRLQQVTGPRTDVIEQTTYSYFPDNDGDMLRRGQLQSVSKRVTGTLSLTTTFAADSSPYNTYSIYGKPKSTTDLNGVVTDFGFDSMGRTLSATIKGVTGDTSPITTSYTYDTAGKLTKISRPLGNATSFTYDSSNRLISEILIKPSTSYQVDRRLYGYDAMSQETSQQSQTCTVPAVSCSSWMTTQQESFQYDGFGRVKEVDHPVPSGSKLLYAYDGDGKVKSIQDENHSTPNTTLAYDYVKRLTSITQSLSGAPNGQITTSTSYDFQDNVTSQTDPNGNVPTTYASDDFNRVRTESSAVRGLSSFTYDAADNVLSKTDANNGVTTYTYDATNRILTSTSSRTGRSTEALAWSYDGTSNAFGQGRLTSVTDPSGSNNFSYDRRGLVKTEVPTIGGHAYPLSYSYDLNGNRLTLTYPGGTTATYTFNYADRPISVKWGSTQIINSASYEPFGPLASLSFANGTAQTLSFNQRYEPIENKLTKGSSIADYTYAEDAVGNITQIHDSLNSAYNRDFGPYDDLNRLTTANSGSSLWGTNTGNGYTYDNMGNIKAIKLGSAHTATFSYSGNLPKLTNVTDSTQNGGAAQSISYDAAGNQTAVGSGIYSYSARNLLATGDGFTYSYDSRGLRVQVSGTPGTRYSIYNSDLNLVSESSLSSSSMVYNYIWFGGRAVAQVNTSGSTNVFSNFTDHLGTPQLQTDTTGTIKWQAEYEPYGRVFSLRSSDVHQPLRLPGQVAEQFDVGANGSTARSYNLRRWYQPAWGRYSQADPIGLKAGQNLFAYVLDNPVTHIDPLGLDILLGFIPDNAWTMGHSFMVIYNPTTLKGDLWEFNTATGLPVLTYGIVWDTKVNLSNPKSFPGDYGDYKMFQFETSANQDAAMTAFWSRVKAETNDQPWFTGRHYNFLTSSCIDAVSSALHAGATLPSPKGAPDLSDIASYLTIYPNQSSLLLESAGFIPTWPSDIQPR